MIRKKGFYFIIIIKHDNYVKCQTQRVVSCSSAAKSTSQINRDRDEAKREQSKRTANVRLSSSKYFK